MAVLNKVLVMAVSLLLACAASAEGARDVEKYRCSYLDMSVTQQQAADGSFLVTVNNGCFNRNCHPRSVMVHCPGYAPTWKVPSWVEFSVYLDPHYKGPWQLCVVNNWQPFVDSFSFSYGQDVMANIDPAGAAYSC